MLAKLESGRMYIGCSEIWPRFGRDVWINTFDSARKICHACTCSMRTLPILRLPGRIGRLLVIDGVLACRPRQPDARRLIRVSVFPTSRATVAPKQPLGGMSDLVRLPSREKWEAWIERGRVDAAAADQRGALAAAGLARQPAASQARAAQAQPRSAWSATEATEPSSSRRAASPARRRAPTMRLART